MAKELISKKTRNEFCEYFVGNSTLRGIEQEFDAADIPWDEQYKPTVSGARRSLVAQYYHSINFTNWRDVRRVLMLFGNVLGELEEQAKDANNSNKQIAVNNFQSLRKWIERDGFQYQDGKVTPVGQHASLQDVHTVAGTFDAPELHRQIERMRDSVEDDPRLAIGTAKELVETTCKTILVQRGVTVDPNWDIGRLVKEARAVLKLLPDDVPEAAKGSESIKRLLSNLGAVGQGLGELRNLYGTGHGPDGKAKGLSARHARLAAGAAATLASFLLETHEAREE
jgi:virulence-associated protein VapD